MPSDTGGKIKTACEQCIRGHRSSQCLHGDRQQIVIRRKGRPKTVREPTDAVSTKLPSQDSNQNSLVNDQTILTSPNNLRANGAQRTDANSGNLQFSNYRRSYPLAMCRAHPYMRPQSSSVSLRHLSQECSPYNTPPSMSRHGNAAGSLSQQYHGVNGIPRTASINHSDDLAVTVTQPPTSSSSSHGDPRMRDFTGPQAVPSQPDPFFCMPPHMPPAEHQYCYPQQPIQTSGQTLHLGQVGQFDTDNVNQVDAGHQTLNQHVHYYTSAHVLVPFAHPSSIGAPATAYFQDSAHCQDTRNDEGYALAQFAHELTLAAQNEPQMATQNGYDIPSEIENGIKHENGLAAGMTTICAPEALCHHSRATHAGEECTDEEKAERFYSASHPF